MVFICNSLLVSHLLDVSLDPELPHEPWLGTLALKRDGYTDADGIYEGVRNVTHISEGSPKHRVKALLLALWVLLQIVVQINGSAFGFCLDARTVWDIK